MVDHTLFPFWLHRGTIGFITSLGIALICIQGFYLEILMGCRISIDSLVGMQSLEGGLGGLS